jgi:hypothetical protein|nr:hypothetical protein [uncultured Selenomonas sp.]
MKIINKRYVSIVLAGMMGIGVLAADLGAVEAKSTSPYINGATNEYSFRMKEEERIHDQNVRRIQFDFRRDGNQEKYDRAMKEEQKRHDRAVKEIKRDYDRRGYNRR